LGKKSGEVASEGGSIAKNPIGELVSIERKIGVEYIAQPIHGPIRLIWANNDSGFDLPVGVTKPLNVLIARSPNEPLELQVVGGPTVPISKACHVPGDLRLTISVRADESEERQLRLCVRWDGTWDGNWPADRIWIE
jgi:hypothetical protein